MKKILLTGFVLSIFSFGCDRCPQVENYFDIEGIRSIYVINNDPNSTSNFIPSDSIKFENFALRTDYTVSFYSSVRPHSFSLVSTAYALSCVEDGDGGTKEKIESLDLFALSDYNKNYKTGSSLLPILKANGLPVPQFIINQNHYGLNQLGFDFSLTERPDDSSIKQSFRIILKLTNGETHEATSNQIRIY